MDKDIQAIIWANAYLQTWTEAHRYETVGDQKEFADLILDEVMERFSN